MAKVKQSPSALLAFAQQKKRLTNAQRQVLCEFLLFDPQAPDPHEPDKQRLWTDDEVAELLNVSPESVRTKREKVRKQIYKKFHGPDALESIIGTTLSHYQTNFALVDQSLRHSTTGSSTCLSHIKLRHQLVRDFLSDLQQLGILPQMTRKHQVELTTIGPGQLIKKIAEVSEQENVDLLEIIANLTSDSTSDDNDTNKEISSS